MPPLPPSPPAHSTPIDKPLPPSPAPSPAHRPAPAPAPGMNPTYREMDIRDRPRAERDRRHPDTGTASDQVGYSSIISSYEMRGDADPWVVSCLYSALLSNTYTLPLTREWRCGSGAAETVS